MMDRYIEQIYTSAPAIKGAAHNFLQKAVSTPAPKHVDFAIRDVSARLMDLFDRLLADRARR